MESPQPLTGHILRVPMHVVSEELWGDPRWCFHCRKRVSFTLNVSLPDDPMSYYGASFSMECEHGHSDGDCFPGTYREWSDDL